MLKSKGIFHYVFREPRRKPHGVSIPSSTAFGIWFGKSRTWLSSPSWHHHKVSQVYHDVEYQIYRRSWLLSYVAVFTFASVIIGGDPKISRKSIGAITRRHNHFDTGSFKLQRALIVTKFSRYEFEQMKQPNLNKDQLEAVIRNRGTNYDYLIELHNLHKNFEQRIVKCFQNVGCEVKLSNRVEFRTSLSKDTIKWADIIVSIGGDGTFLLAANRASPLFSQHKTPIVGFNSDTQRSEGRLLLPKHYSECPEDAVAKIKSGEFHWMHRTRIRTSLLGNNGHIPESIDLYRHTITKMEQEKIEPEYLNEYLANKYKAKMKRLLPYLALNEVFIGESLSARVSLLQLVLDHKDVVYKTKCSGLCVSTGTGSTSWHTSINRITTKTVEDLIKILPADVSKNLKNADTGKIAHDYNQSLLFAPDDPRFCYSIREQICGGVWPNPKEFDSRNFAKALFVQSRCIDANLVIDGSISYPFNDGATALLEIRPEDALLTIAL